jgi:hypothetical protein
MTRTRRPLRRSKGEALAGMLGATALRRRAVNVPRRIAPAYAGRCRGTAARGRAACASPPLWRPGTIIRRRRPLAPSVGASHEPSPPAIVGRRQATRES